VQLAGSDYLLNLPTHLSQGLKNRDASLRPVFSLQVPIPAGLHPLRLAGLFGVPTRSWPCSPAIIQVAYACHAPSYRARTRPISCPAIAYHPPLGGSEQHMADVDGATPSHTAGLVGPEHYREGYDS